MAEKWDGRMPGIGTGPGTWEERARRAEAETEAARASPTRKLLDGEARVLRARAQPAPRRRASISWRITAPLRWLARRPR